MDLGLFFGLLSSLPNPFPTLVNILHNENIDSFCRAFAAIKTLEIIAESAAKVPEREKIEESKLIHDFVETSYELEIIIPVIGELRTLLGQCYSDTLKFLIRKFCINDDIIRLGKAAYNHKENFDLECSLFYYSKDQLIRIEN